MSSKNKTARYTPFAEYMRDRLPDLQRNRLANNVQECVPICRPEWLAMTPEQQNVYSLRAKELKEREQTEGRDVKWSNGQVSKNRGNDDRRNNQGFTVNETRLAYDQLNSKRDNEREYARRHWPQSVEAMKNMPFHLIEFEYACEIQQPYMPLCWLPVEIAIVAWNMSDGVFKRYHKFIDPGVIPLGYTSDCRTRSEIHQIPHEKFDLADTDYASLWHGIEQSVRSNPPILYCKAAQKDMVQYCLHWIHLMSRTPRENRFRVYALEDCIQDLVKHVDKSISLGSVSKLLQSSTYDYEQGSFCKYHYELENIHCALVNCNRNVFNMILLLSQPDYYNFPLNRNYIPVIDAREVDPMRPMSERKRPERPAASVGGASARSDGDGFGSRDIRYYKINSEAAGEEVRSRGWKSVSDEAESHQPQSNRALQPPPGFASHTKQAAKLLPSKISKSSSVFHQDFEDDWPPLVSGRGIGRAQKLKQEKPIPNWSNVVNVGHGRGRGIVTKHMIESMSSPGYHESGSFSTNAEDESMKVGNKRGLPGRPELRQPEQAANAENTLHTNMLGMKLSNFLDDDDDDEEFMDPVHPVFIGGRGKKFANLN